jgi:hypothetical protein
MHGTYNVKLVSKLINREIYITENGMRNSQLINEQKLD